MGAKFFGLFAENRERLGFITIIKHEHLSHLNDSEILEIGILPKHRNNGHGSQLLKFAEDYSKRNDFYCIHMTAYAGDFRAIHFYGKNGFVPVAVIPDTNGPGDEGDIYLRKLIGESG